MRSLVGSLVNARRAAPATVRRASTAVSSFFGADNDRARLMGAMAEVGTVYAIVDRIVSGMSSVEWHLYRRAKSGKDEDRIEITSHAALDLLNKPNPFMTRKQMFQVCQQHHELTGELDIMINFVGKLPVELWPVRPDRIKPVPAGSIYPGDIAGYLYMPADRNGEVWPLENRELLRALRPNPLDPYNGLGPVQSILTDIDSSKYSAEWNKNFFLNSAEPGGIIQVEGRLSDDRFEELRARWSEQHKGVAKAHRVAIIEEGSQWVDRKMTQRDMEFTALSGLSRDKILEAFGMPKSMLGIVEDVNRANAETSEYVFAKWIETPRLDDWKELLNFKLLPMYAGGEELEFDYDSPVPENSDQANAAISVKWSAAVSAVGAGFEPAEMLEALELPAVSFEKPEPAPLPGALPAEGDPQEEGGQKSTEEGSSGRSKPRDVAGVLARMREIEDAQRWEAVEEDDDSTCEPCKGNRGKTYKNREAAYEDYPDGKHYRNCVGEEYGNHCRGFVRKRRKSNESS